MVQEPANNAGTVDPEGQDWKQRLTPEQYHVAREGGTEHAFSGIYWDLKDPGTYKCVCCRTALFRSDEKYDSGSGWPSFWRPIEGAPVVEVVDNSNGMVRTEVRCGACDAHLGHLFPDGPDPSGQRYCINSASLEFQERRE